MSKPFIALRSLFVLSLGLAIAGCGGGGSKKLTVYTAFEDDQYPAYLEDFKEKHPEIDVTVVRDSTGVIMAKAIAEKDSPQADVLWGIAVTELLGAKSTGLLKGYAPEELDKIDPRFRDSANPPLWVGLDSFMTAFCVNTIELKNKKLPMPTSLEDLTKPPFAGQVVMPNPASSGTGFMAVSGVLQSMGEEAGWAALENLHKNVAQYVHSGSQPCKMAGAGEYAAGISFDYRGIKQKAEGQPVEVIFPREGSGWDVEAAALVNKKEIQPEAKTFLDWAVSESAMKKYAANSAVMGRMGVTGKIEGYPANPEKQLVKNDFDWASENRQAIMDEWTKRFGAKSAPKE